MMVDIAVDGVRVPEALASMCLVEEILQHQEGGIFGRPGGDWVWVLVPDAGGQEVGGDSGQSLF